MRHTLPFAIGHDIKSANVHDGLNPIDTGHSRTSSHHKRYLLMKQSRVREAVLEHPPIDI